LITLLSDGDTNVAAASATALGRIGGREAIAALSTARDQSPPVVQAAVLASLLQCADRLGERNDKRGAAALFRELYDDRYPMGIRLAAWRGLALSDSAHHEKLMVEALCGTDRAIQLAAIQVLRESSDRRVVQACAIKWASLPVEAQLAVIDAEVKQGANGLWLVRIASHSQLVTVRAAGWTALGNLDDLASIPALAQAAAAGADETERQAARDSLARLRGEGASKALLAAVKNAATPEKAELLQVLGVRQDGNATKVLLQNAAAGDATVRQAALDSLGAIAPPEALSPLLEIAAKAGSDDLRQHALDALGAVCQASPDKDAASRTVVESMGRLPATEQGAFFNLLAGLGTPAALAPVQAVSRSQDIDLAKQAVRALAQWPNAAPAVSLLELARTSSDPVLGTLAFRGAIAVNGTEPNVSKRTAFLKKALQVAHRPDEKKEALGQVGQIATPEALAVAVSALADPDVANEATLAVLGIAEKLSRSHPQLVQAAAVKVLEQKPGGELFQRVWALRLKPTKHIPFIRDWVVCGPYSKAGVSGATAIFNVPFGPELRDQKVDWKDVPAEDHIGLANLYPGAENCDAYLRTTIVAPANCSAMLMMGSDDGVKAWLNGALVHSKNVNRPDVVDEDIAPVTLKQGANELVLKISQGGGGWSACARIVGADGNPIPGLKIERPTGASGLLAGAQ
jgi:HEAT repeat protein